MKQLFRLAFALLSIILLVTSPAIAQKKNSKSLKSQTRPRTTKKPVAQPDANPPRVIGSPVEIVTRNGDRISGELLELTAYSLRIRSDRLESTIALDTVASLSFGQAPAAPESTPAAGPSSAGFARDASTALSSYESIATNLQSGIDYTEFGRQVGELRRVIDRLISKHSSTQNLTELRVISLLLAGQTDYNWSRNIWTLKFGRSNDGTASESDSPALADALSAYPELRSSSDGSNRFSIDRIVAGLWKKAGEKADRVRTLLGTPK
jgi:hypothetical protein